MSILRNQFPGALRKAIKYVQPVQLNNKLTSDPRSLSTPVLSQIKRNGFTDRPQSNHFLSLPGRSSWTAGVLRPPNREIHWKSWFWGKSQEIKEEEEHTKEQSTSLIQKVSDWWYKRKDIEEEESDDRISKNPEKDKYKIQELCPECAREAKGN